MSAVHKGPSRPTTVIVGLGIRSAATGAEVLALIETTLAEHGLDRTDIFACATLAGKHLHPALQEAATVLGVELKSFDAMELRRPVPNPSLLVQSRIGLPSVAEAAALTFGPLIAEKRRSPNATCALSCLQPVTASSAASTLVTSSAGP